MGESIHSTPAPTNRVEENDVIRMMRLLFNEQSIKSVSYTHLDVYKRQTANGW